MVIPQKIKFDYKANFSHELGGGMRHAHTFREDDCRNELENNNSSCYVLLLPRRCANYRNKFSLECEWEAATATAKQPIPK